MKNIKYYILLALFIIIAIGVLFPEDNTSNETATSSDVELNTEADFLKVHIINIGQGDSILLESSTDTILIDGGNKGKGDEVIDYLKENGISKLSAVVSTHPDADHVGGLADIINSMTVEAVYAPRVTHTTEAYKEFLLAVKAQSLKIKVAKNGVIIPSTASDLTMEFIGPTKQYSASDLNNWSAVLQVTHGENKFLFTGDAETPAENDMINAGILEDIDVLKVSHHGAKEATNANFLAVVKPEIAAISVGKGNRYDHPTASALQRLKKVGATVYRTDQNGNIIFNSDGKDIIVEVER